MNLVESSSIKLKFESSSLTKFYNSDDVNPTTAELREIKTRRISFKMIDVLLYETKMRGVNKILKTYVKICQKWFFYGLRTKIQKKQKFNM